jgi:hypothetical protein
LFGNGRKRHKNVTIPVGALPTPSLFQALILFVEEADFAGGKIVDAADQADLMLFQHLAQNGTAFTDLLHDQMHVSFGNLVHEFQVL